MQQEKDAFSHYQPLFDHLYQEHGITATGTEMADIIDIVHKLYPQPTGSGVWVKASERIPKNDNPVFLKVSGLKRLGNFFEENGKPFIYVQGTAPFTIDEDNFYSVEWYDEPNEQPAVEQKEWDSNSLIGRVKDRFIELEEKQWDWPSFYGGWIEGRADMLQQIKGWGQYKPEQKENEAVGFHDWARNNTVADGSPRLLYIPANERMTTAQLYSEFKKQNKQ